MLTRCGEGIRALLLLTSFVTYAVVARAEEEVPKVSRPPNHVPFAPDVFNMHTNGRPQISLDGSWEFRRDPDGVGAEQGWHEGRGEFDRSITIPGAPQAQGIGEPTYRQKSFFMEPFWVRRTFEGPAVEKDQRIWLRLGGIQPAAEIYINGNYLGYTKSSRTPQRLDVTEYVKPREENRIAIKICDFPEVRLDGLWEMAECGLYWSGVHRPVHLEITDKTALIDYYLTTDLAEDTLHVTATMHEPPPVESVFILNVRDGDREVASSEIMMSAGQAVIRSKVALDDYETWSPENPKLYELVIQLKDRTTGRTLDRVNTRFGMRHIERKGTKIHLNGKPIFLRAFGDDHYYPKTLSPPTDKQWYLERLQRARAYGMNAAKGCVEPMPPEYLDAADEAGIIIIQEMPFGLSALRANRYTIEKPFIDFQTAELENLIRVSRNHACVLSYSMSSELEFHNQTQQSFNFFSRDLVKLTRNLAPHTLAIDCTGYVNTLETDKGTRDTDLYASIIPTWMKRTLDETPVATDRKRPTILHEYNWWSCYPDPADKAKYEGMQLKPFWLDTLVETARKNGQEDLLPIYRRNSLWLQPVTRKDGIEFARRNPDAEGYILWLLIDFGQYSEGLLDDFWNPKNVTADEFLESNGDTIIVLAEEGHRCLTNGTEARIPLAISHYGPEPLEKAGLRWKVSGNGVNEQGRLNVPSAACGELTPAGEVLFKLPPGEQASEITLEVAWIQGEKELNTNRWSFWTFPETPEAWNDPRKGDHTAWFREQGIRVRTPEQAGHAIPSETSLVIAERMDEPLAEFIENGGSSLLLLSDVAILNRNIYYGTVSFYPNFRTIPWNAGTSGNSGTVITSHPALAKYPHADYCDLHFVWMFRDALPMEFEPLRAHGVQPIIRMIDHYAANRNNAHLLEFTCGKGKVLATSLSILPRLSDRIEARYLLQCLAEHAANDAHHPDATIPGDLMRKWFSPEGEREKTSGPDELLK